MGKYKTTDEFIKKSKDIHGNKYDYSLADYINSKSKIKIICPIHGVFEQTPNNHLSKKQGCSKCSGKYKKTTIDFINDAKKIHGDKYDYSLVEYKNIYTRIIIICPIHGIFKQKPEHHMNGNGCPKCNSSKGEKIISNILKTKNFDFETQKMFNGCIYKRKLPFDFYLPNYNLCIEYDDIQHYEPIEFFGGEKAFIKNQNRDKIKNQYCKDNNIVLIRIKYDENINNKLVHVLNDIKNKNVKI